MARFVWVLVFGLLYPALSHAATPDSTPKVTSFKAPKNGKLTLEMLNFYEENGFLVLTGLTSSKKTKRLRSKAINLAKKYNKVGGVHTFVTADDDEDAQEAYYKFFFDSADKISPFYEADGVDGNIVLFNPESSMNKLAHALHALDPDFKKLTSGNKSTARKFKGIAKSLEIKKPTIIQSMIIFKPAEIGGAIPPHQDATFLYTDPITVTGFWLALEKADRENSCLWVIPGGHKGELSARSVLNEDEDATELIDNKDLGWKDEDFVPVEVEPGTLIILHGKLPHKSEKKNNSNRSRIAYTFHAISDEAKYSNRNWMQNPLKVPLYDKEGREGREVRF